MVIAISVTSDDGEWELTANYCEKKKQYYMAGLSVPKELDTSYWDNNDYLFKELFPMVEKIYHKQSLVPVRELSWDVYQYLIDNRDAVEQLYELLLFGKTMGWDKIK